MEVFHLLTLLGCFFITGESAKDTLYPVKVGPTEPCDDFYSFTCTTWDSKTTQGPIPTSEKLLDERLKGILSGQDEITIPSKAVQKAKNMYKTCLNNKSRHKASLLKKLRDFGGWPILDPNWKNSQFTWKKLIASLRRLGYSFLIKINVHPDELNATRHKIALSSVNPSSESSFQSSTDTDGKYFQNYGRFIAHVVRYIRTSNSTWPTIEEQIRDIIDFQAQLDNIPRVKSTERYAKITSKTAANVRMTTAQLTQVTSRAFDWQQLFDSIFDGIASVSNHVRIIEVKDLNYVKKIGSLLEKTDPRTISNFLLWKFVEDVAEDGDEMLVAINSEYHKNLNGNSPSKQDTCLKEVKGFMGYTVTNLIANDIQPQHIISKVKEVAEYVHRAYKDLVSNATWIKEPIRSNLLNKLDHLQINIGYPEWIISNSHLDQYYSQIHIGDDHFENVMSASEAYAFEELSQLGSAPDRNSWSITPVMTNAFYNTILNTVYIPLAILQVPIVDPSWPMSMIFGSVGAVIGHEMSHGFEDPELYGDNDTSQSNIYDRQTECINKLYGAFCPFRGTEDTTTNSIAIRAIYQNLCVNGLKTLHENVADFNGIQAAFKAFQAWRKVGIEDRGTAENLGGFAPNQLFFIGYGRMWCGSAKNFGLVHQILTSYNAPNRYRLTGSLSSLSEEFRETFMCQVSRAAEKPSCKIW